jgi:8-oxo-dGTP diphosphatase
MKLKVYAYITHANRVLIFRHNQFHEAGLQVPGGTVKTGEALEAAILREAAEESSLEGLKIVSYLGSRDYDLESLGLGQGIQRSHFYHLELEGDDPPTAWISYEEDPSNGDPAPIEFECFWVPLDQVPELAGDQGALLDRLHSSTSFV